MHGPESDPTCWKEQQEGEEGVEVSERCLELLGLPCRCELARYLVVVEESELCRDLLTESEVVNWTLTHSWGEAKKRYLQLCASSLRTTGPNKILDEPHSAVHMLCIEATPASWEVLARDASPATRRDDGLSEVTVGQLCKLQLVRFSWPCFVFLVVVCASGAQMTV